MNSTMNYYELLGVSKDATYEEIKLAYKKQMKKWHPDLNKSSDASIMSSKINEAKEVLLDEIKRKDYDEYLEKKIEENYNRYTQNKKEDKTTYEQKEQYDNNTVTKWQYLSDWLKYANVSFFRKTIGVIGVILESLICWLIKILLIITAFICNLGSHLIKQFFSYLAPLFGILGILALGQILTNGFNYMINENRNIFNAILVFVCLFISSFILPIISNMLLSPKAFDVLYNKIDINLFKKCVGYKE